MSIQVNLTSNTLIIDGVEVDVSARQAEVLSILTKHIGPQNAISYDRIFELLYGATLDCDMPAAPKKALKVHICAIRKIINPLGYDIGLVWSYGHYLYRQTHRNYTVVFQYDYGVMGKCKDCLVVDASSPDDALDKVKLNVKLDTTESVGETVLPIAIFLGHQKNLVVTPRFHDLTI